MRFPLRIALTILLSLLIGLPAGAQKANTATPPKARKAKATKAKPAKAKYTLKVATFVPDGSTPHKILKALDEEWRRAPGGGVALDIAAGGVQGSEVEVVGRIRRGQLHGGLLSAGGMGEIDDSVESLQSMPMMFRSLDEVDYVRDKLKNRIEAKLLEKGFVVLFWSDAGWARFFTKQRVITPDDLKKIDLFVTAGDTKQLDIMKALGYKPIPLSPNDILSGLQTGLITGVLTVPVFALGGQFYTKAPHMLELNFAPLVGGFVVDKRQWDKLPPETRKFLAASALRAGDKMKAHVRNENDRAVAVMKKNKLNVHPVTPAVEEQWRVAMQKVYPKIRGGIIPADYFDDVQRLLDEYRKVKPAGAGR